MAIQIGLVGLGKIASDQHVPALQASSDFTLCAIASRNAALEGCKNFSTITELISAGGVRAVSLCTPPSGRYEQARTALQAGLHVMLEKPPGATLSEVEALHQLALRNGATLYATWHSRMAPAVAPAKVWLADKRIKSVRMAWREDIRKWHPGQEWILGPGGFGVFDPAINGLSILSTILPDPLLVESGLLEYPAGRAAPIRGSLAMLSGDAPVSVDLDFEAVENPEWSIAVDTPEGEVLIEDGGAKLTLNGSLVSLGEEREYPELYDRFASLIAAGECDVDVAPLRLVADALLVADRREGPPFSF